MRSWYSRLLPHRRFVRLQLYNLVHFHVSYDINSTSLLTGTFNIIRFARHLLLYNLVYFQHTINMAVFSFSGTAATGFFVEDVHAQAGQPDNDAPGPVNAFAVLSAGGDPAVQIPGDSSLRDIMQHVPGF